MNAMGEDSVGKEIDKSVKGMRGTDSEYSKGIHYIYLGSWIRRPWL